MRVRLHIPGTLPGNARSTGCGEKRRRVFASASRAGVAVRLIGGRATDTCSFALRCWGNRTAAVSRTRDQPQEATFNHLPPSAAQRTGNLASGPRYRWSATQAQSNSLRIRAQPSQVQELIDKWHKTGYLRPKF